MYLPRKERKRNELDWLVRESIKRTIKEIEESYSQYLKSILQFNENSKLYFIDRKDKFNWNYDLTAEDQFLYEEDIRLSIYRNLLNIASEWKINSKKIKKLFVHGQHQQKIEGKAVFPDLMIWKVKKGTDKNKNSLNYWEKVLIEIKFIPFEPKDWDWLRKDISKLNKLSNTANSGYFICPTYSGEVKKRAEERIKKLKQEKNIEAMIYVPIYIKQDLPKYPYNLTKIPPEYRIQCLILEILSNKLKGKYRPLGIKPEKYPGPYFYNHIGKIDQYVQIIKIKDKYYIITGTSPNLKNRLYHKLKNKGFNPWWYNHKNQEVLLKEYKKPLGIIIYSRKKLDSIENCISFAKESYKRLIKLNKIIATATFF